MDRIWVSTFFQTKKEEVTDSRLSLYIQKSVDFEP